MIHTKIRHPFNDTFDSLRKIKELTVLYEISQHFISLSDPHKMLLAVLDILHAKMGMKKGLSSVLLRQESVNLKGHIEAHFFWMKL